MLQTASASPVTPPPAYTGADIAFAKTLFRLIVARAQAAFGAKADQSASRIERHYERMDAQQRERFGAPKPVAAVRNPQRNGELLRLAAVRVAVEDLLQELERPESERSEDLGSFAESEARIKACLTKILAPEGAPVFERILAQTRRAASELARTGPQGTIAARRLD